MKKAHILGAILGGSLLFNCKNVAKDDGKLQSFEITDAADKKTKRYLGPIKSDKGNLAVLSCVDKQSYAEGVNSYQGKEPKEIISWAVDEGSKCRFPMEGVLPRGGLYMHAKGIFISPKLVSEFASKAWEYIKETYCADDEEIKPSYCRWWNTTMPGAIKNYMFEADSFSEAKGDGSIYSAARRRFKIFRV